MLLNLLSLLIRYRCCRILSVVRKHDNHHDNDDDVDDDDDDDDDGDDDDVRKCGSRQGWIMPFWKDTGSWPSPTTSSNWPDCTMAM